MLEDCDIDIRPVFEMEDFGDVVTPEIAASERQLREKLASRLLTYRLRRPNAKALRMTKKPRLANGYSSRFAAHNESAA